jgi:hypothetical protein
MLLIGERKSPELNIIRSYVQKQQAGASAPEDKFDENGEGLLRTRWLADTVLCVCIGLFNLSSNHMKYG